MIVSTPLKSLRPTRLDLGILGLALLCVAAIVGLPPLLALGLLLGGAILVGTLIAWNRRIKAIRAAQAA